MCLFLKLFELTSSNTFLPQVKCHQYWPNPSGSATYGGFQVSCQTEEGNSAFLVRDMTLNHIEVSVSQICLSTKLVFDLLAFKGMVYPKRKIILIIHSLSPSFTRHSEPVWLSVFCGTQKRLRMLVTKQLTLKQLRLI